MVTPGGFLYFLQESFVQLNKLRWYSWWHRAPAVLEAENTGNSLRTPYILTRSRSSPGQSDEVIALHVFA
jgi:hypothetical protein